MSITKPTEGQEDWDVPLNAALDALDGSITGHTGGSDPHGDRAYADAAFLPRALITVSDLTGGAPYYIAHRGSGGEFPEHTMIAYRSAVAAGAKAIEVSVQTTADGVPVCMHDTTLDRTTNATGDPADYTYAELIQSVQVDVGASLLGAGWADQPIPTMREVLDEFLGKVVIFLEAKSNAAIPIVQDILTTFYPQAADSVIWKNYYTSSSFAWARAHGFRVWAYVDAFTTQAEMDAVDADVDLWGVPTSAADSMFTDTLARPGGKQVIAWEVHRHSEVDRLVGLGVQGLMAAQWIYLNNAPQLTVDRFTNSVSTPGTLGVSNYTSSLALKYDGAGGAYIDSVPNRAVLMGGHKAATDDDHTIAFSMKWDTLPAGTLHSDLAFCKASDDAYQFSTANASGGYHAVLRASGDLQIYRHDPGVTSGTQLGTLSVDPGDAPVAGTYMDFTIQVTPTQVILTRTDTVSPYTLTVSDTTYRGPYWHLGVGSVNNLANKPTWANITVS